MLHSRTLRRFPYAATVSDGWRFTTAVLCRAGLSRTSTCKLFRILLMTVSQLWTMPPWRFHLCTRLRRSRLGAARGTTSTPICGCCARLDKYHVSRIMCFFRPQRCWLCHGALRITMALVSTLSLLHFLCLRPQTRLVAVLRRRGR